MRSNHASVELDVPLQLELVGDEVQVTHNLRLTGIAFGPFPFSHQLGRERVPVDMAFGVASRAGVAVPVPGATDTAARFERLDGQAEAVAQAEQLVQAGEARADH
jgi:hypothetical protein